MPQYRKGRPSPWMVQVRDSQGKLKTASFSTKEAAEEFERNEKEKRRRIKHGLQSPREKTLFLDFSASWLRKRYSTMPRSTVDQDNRRLRKYWLPILGTRPLEFIRPAEILAELDRIQHDLKRAPAERNRHRALLHKLFQDAFMEDRIDVNPVSRIPLVDESRKTRKGSVLRPEEQAIYLNAMYEEGYQYGILANLLIWTGARVCSAIAAQYRDINFEEGVFRIRRLLERASGTIQERQKDEGENGETIVPIFPSLKVAISSHMQKSPYTKATHFIASQVTGSYIPYDTFKQVHRRVIKRTGLPLITIHDLRRTFATNALRAGYSKSEVKDMLGHSTELMTEKYTMKDISHLVEKGKRIGFGEDQSLQNVVSLRR